MRLSSVGLVGALLLITILFGACGSSETPQGERGNGSQMGGGDWAANNSAPELSVKAQEVRLGNVATFIMASTTLEAVRTVDVYSKGTGLATEVNFEEGDVVDTNQLLVKLDEREVLNDYNQARLAVQQSEIALQQARVRKNQSASDFQRNKQLLEENLVSQQEYDKTELDDKYAQLTLDNSEYDLTVNKERFEAAQIQMENTKILAPIKGIVSSRIVERGQMIRANDAVCTITDLDNLLARIYIPETEMQRIQLGQSARIEAESMPGKIFQGKVKLISPVINSQTGTGKVTVEIHDSSRQLKPGMFVNTYLTTSVHNNVVKILRKAIWHEKEEDWVFVIKDDNTVEKRKISTGYIENEWIEITDGLQAKEIVVTVGQDSLDSGFPVKVAEYEGGTPTNPRPATPAVKTASQEGGPSATPDANTAAANRGDRQGDGRRGGPGRGMSPEMREIMQNPEAQKEMMAARQKDPEMMRDPEKRAEFFKKLAEKYGKK